MIKNLDKDSDQVNNEYKENEMKIDNLIKRTNTGAFDTGQSCCIWVTIFFSLTPHLLK